jgi:hypothetical protein
MAITDTQVVPARFRQLSAYYDQSLPPWVISPPTPTLTALDPASIVAGDPPVVVTLTGTNFTPLSKVWADEEAQATTYVDATTLAYNAQADMVGSQTITVHNEPEVSNAIELEVTDGTESEPAPEPESAPVEEPEL